MAKEIKKEDTQGKEIKVNNADQKEFERLYGEIINEHLDYQNYFHQQMTQHERNVKDLSALKKIAKLLDKEEDEEIADFKKQVIKQIVQGEEQLSANEKAIPIFKEHYERCERFIKMFKAGILIQDEENNADLSEGVLMLLEYLHTIRKVLAPEPETQEIKQEPKAKTKQTQ